MANAIEVTDLSKSFRTPALTKKNSQLIPALSHLNLEVSQGECFALLGPNGAGKTTLIKILSTLIWPDEGEVKIAGYDLKEQQGLIKSKIGLVTSEERSFYWRLSGRENLQFFARFSNLSPALAGVRIKELAELFGIAQQLDNRFAGYSAGTKQKMAILRSLLHQPQVLLIDEPTKSLDPSGARNLRTFIKEELVLKQKKTVFFTTHQTEEAEMIAQRIAIMDKGSIEALGTLEQLRRLTALPSASLYQIFAKLTDTHF